MLKRLIEVALPLKEVSAESAHDNRIRSGHIRTLHIWWARRPLAACRAIVFASLVPDPDDPECPPQFRKLVIEVLDRGEFTPKNGDGSTVEDTPRNRCLEFIKQLVKWENSHNPEYIEPARKLIAAAHKFLHSGAEGDAPKVLDPFAGGGAIPLEALRLGCEAHAVDLNPVAHLIELCTLVFPQQYGQPDSRAVPDYIKRLVAHNNVKKKSPGEQRLFDDGEAAVTRQEGEIIPNIQISEAEYRKNPLAADVKYWGHWIFDALAAAKRTRYLDPLSDERPLAYLWARTVECPNPTCKALIPLLRQLWLCKKPRRKIALKPFFDPLSKATTFVIAEDGHIDFDPNEGTVSDGKAQCPFCSSVADGSYLRERAVSGTMGQQMTTVVFLNSAGEKKYRSSTHEDVVRFEAAESDLAPLAASIPTEPIPQDRPSPNSRGLSGVARYGFERFGDMFNPRQADLLLTVVELIHEASGQIAKVTGDREYVRAIAAYLAFVADKVADFGSSFCRWGNDDEGVTGTFGRQAVGMVWDYAETNPLSDKSGGFRWATELVVSAIKTTSLSCNVSAHVRRGSASRLPFGDATIDAVVVDPPYYDSVPYGDLSDYFYVWLKRSLNGLFGDVFSTSLTPKSEETIAYWGSLARKRAVQKPPEWYEQQIAHAFGEMARSLSQRSIASIMFAHKTTTAWESIVSALSKSGMFCTASWPIHTEGRGRLTSQDAAALASSITLICRKRGGNAENGLWDDVRQELKTVAQERLDFFWKQGIRGADFFISAIGPALSVFGKYEKVTKLSGEEVTVGQFLDEVRGLVTSYALAKILKTTHTGTIDPESRFYVVWKWSYADTKVPADESFKLSQALGLDTETLWDKTGVLEKSGENVQATPVAKRIKLKSLGEPAADGAPASVIDVLHRMCAFREKSDTQGMAEFLGRSGHANNHSLWLIAQAVSEILPDGDKEKQLMQGLLNQKEGLEEATRQKGLF